MLADKLHRVNNGNFDLFDEDSRENDRRLNTSISDASDFVVDIREYDVPYHVRVLIDKGSSSTPFLSSWLSATLTSCRHTGREMVFCRGKARHYNNHLQRGALGHG